MAMPAINVAAFDPKVAGSRFVRNLRGDDAEVACHIELSPIQVESFGTNEVKITFDGVSRIVDAFALSRAINAAILQYRKGSS